MPETHQSTPSHSAAGYTLSIALATCAAVGCALAWTHLAGATNRSSAQVLWQATAVAPPATLPLQARLPASKPEIAGQRQRGLVVMGAHGHPFQQRAGLPSPGTGVLSHEMPSNNPLRTGAVATVFMAFMGTLMYIVRRHLGSRPLPPAAHHHNPLLSGPSGAVQWTVAGISGEEGFNLDKAGPADTEPWNAIRWLPELDINNEEESEPKPGERVMPCFLIEAMAYLPDSKRMLNIIEKRYRQMYSDILFNGSRCFVVAFLPPDGAFKGKFMAEVGVIFYLEELEDLSEQTQDRVKWRCVHTVTQRVRIKRVLNPHVLKKRPTYLRVVVEDLEEEDDEETDTKEAEDAVTAAFNAIVKLQQTVGEVTRFEVDTDLEPLVNMGAKGKLGLWKTARLWQSLLMSRIGSIQQSRDAATYRMLNDWMAKRAQGLTDFVEDPNIDWEKVKPGEQVAIDWKTLPLDLRRDILEMHKLYEERSASDMQALGTGFQEMVQEPSHAKRVDILRAMLEKEQDRLEAKQNFQFLP